MDIITTISQESRFKPEHIKAVLSLHSEGCTIPFMAKYRQEKISSISESAIKKILERHEELTSLKKNKASLIKKLTEQDELTEAIKKNIQAAKDEIEFEDLAQAYQPRQKSPVLTLLRASLKPVVEKILKQEPLEERHSKQQSIKTNENKTLTPQETQNQTQIFGEEPLESIANTYVNEASGIKNSEKVLESLRTILKEEFLRTTGLRRELRRIMRSESFLKITSSEKTSEKTSKFREFENTTKALRSLSSHQFLTIQSGVRQKRLVFLFETNDDKVLDTLFQKYIPTEDPATKFLLEGILTDIYHNHLKKPAESTIIKLFWQEAEEATLEDIKTNLKDMLMQPKFGHKPLLAIDPGTTENTLLAMIDKTGKSLSSQEINLKDSENKAKAVEVFQKLIDDHKPELISVSSHENARKTWEATKDILKELKKEIPAIISDTTFSDHCALSKEASKEFKNDRLCKAVHSGRFLQDPLIEIIKLDPLALPLGPQMRTINRNQAKTCIESLIQTAVNKTGMDLNLCDASTLKHISGLDGKLAKEIVKYRETNGPFKTRQDLMSVPGMTPKHFFLCAGFLRIPDAENPLEKTAIHPERYELTENIAKALNKSVADLFTSPDEFKNLDFKQFEKDDVGLETLRHIMAEFRNPGKDSRPDYEVLEPDPITKSIHNLKPDQIIKGRVVHFASFGAFIDLGVGQSALLHNSSMTDSRSNHPTPAVKLGRVLTFQITEVDKEKNRIQVGFPRPKRHAAPPRRERQDSNKWQSRGPGKGSHDRRPPHKGHHKHSKDKRRGPPRNQFGTLGDQFKDLFK